MSEIVKFLEWIKSFLLWLKSFLIKNVGKEEEVKKHDLSIKIEENDVK